MFIMNVGLDNYDERQVMFSGRRNNTNVEACLVICNANAWVEYGLRGLLLRALGGGERWSTEPTGG